MARRNEMELVLVGKDEATPQLKTRVKGLETQSKGFAATWKQHWLSNTAIVLGAVIAVKKIGDAFVGAIKSAVDFESAFAGVRKTVDATEAEFAQLSTGLREMAKNIPVTAVELAKIQEIAGQLGVSGVKNLQKFTETIAKIAVTTNLTREAAATNFARIANIMQEPLDNVDRMGASIVDLGNNFATTEAEITEFANRIAGAGQVAGLTTADIMGFGAAFSSVGVRAERGGTAVSKALIMMGTAVAEGGEKLEDFADIAGLTSEEFVTAYKENAGRAFALFIEGLGKAGLKGAEILKELELGDQRLVQSFLSVGGASGILTDALDKSSKAYEENNALNEEAEKRFATTASQIEIFKNNVNDLNISLGDTFLPILNDILPALTGVIEKLQSLTEEDVQRWTAIGLISSDPMHALSIAAEMVINRIKALAGAKEEQVAGLSVSLEQEVALVKKAEESKTKLIIKENKKKTKAEIEAEKDKMAMRRQANIDNANMLKQTLTMAAAENEKFAILLQVYNIGEAIMNTALGVTQALASYPPPLSFVMAALVSAMGAAQVGIITAQTFGGAMAKGGEGIVDKPTWFLAGEAGPERFNFAPIGKERSGSSIQIFIEINNPIVRSDDDIDTLVEEISTKLAQEAERI